MGQRPTAGQTESTPTGWDINAEWGRAMAEFDRLLGYIQKSRLHPSQDPYLLAHETIQETVLRCYRTGRRIRQWYPYLKHAAALILRRPFPREFKLTLAFSNLWAEPDLVAANFPSRRPGPRSRLLARELGIGLWRQIRSLPPKQRRVAGLHYQGFTAPEIALHLNMSPGAVRFQKHQAFRNLQKTLNQEVA